MKADTTSGSITPESPGTKHEKRKRKETDDEIDVTISVRFLSIFYNSCYIIEGYAAGIGFKKYCRTRES